VFTHRQRSYDVVLGIAPSCAVLGRLGWAYPWLPAELAASWNELRTGSERPDSGQLEHA
jgi:hypothetical protein